MAAAEKFNNDTLACRILNCKGIYEANVNVNPYLAHYYFLRSLSLAQKNNLEKMTGSLNMNLAILLKDSAGLRYAYDAYKYGVKHNEPDLRDNGAVELAMLNHILGHNDESEKYYHIALELCKKDGINMLGHLYLLRSYQLEQKADLAGAQDFALKGIDAMKESYVSALPSVYLQLANVQYKMQKYQDCILTLHQALDASDLYSSYSKRADIYDLLANAYLALGDKQNAIDCMSKAREASDSTHRADKQHLIIQRDMMLNLAQKENEASLNAMRIDYLSRLNIAMGIAIALLALCCILVIRYHRRKQQLYDNIVLQNQKLMAAEEQLAKLPTSATMRIQEDVADINQEAVMEITNQELEEETSVLKDSDDSSVTVHSGIMPNAAELYDKACLLMREKRLYADPQFTREALIEMLGTNRTYLSNIIQRYGGTNYSQWINSWRIKEAVNVLADKSRPDYPLKRLSSDVGFGSLTSFYKAFRTEIGISPSDYRKSAQNLK